jgi:hypothetical protein
MPPRIYENGKQTGGFAHFLAFKAPKTPFFAQKHLRKYTPETFFEESTISKIFCYLRHCGVMPVQSFGSVGGGKYDTLVVHGINLQYLYDNILFHG